VTLSRKGAKSRTGVPGLRSTGTKASTRVGQVRKPRADLERQLEKYRRELAEARDHLAEALEQQHFATQLDGTGQKINGDPFPVSPKHPLAADHLLAFAIRFRGRGYSVVVPYARIRLGVHPTSGGNT
jgi:hypothetical protein